MHQVHSPNIERGISEIQKPKRNLIEEEEFRSIYQCVPLIMKTPSLTKCSICKRVSLNILLEEYKLI